MSASSWSSRYTAAITGDRARMIRHIATDSPSSIVNAYWNSRSWSSSSCATNSSSMPTRLSAMSEITVVETMP